MYGAKIKIVVQIINNDKKTGIILHRYVILIGVIILSFNQFP